jgi:hypothetical protein
VHLQVGFDRSLVYDVTSVGTVHSAVDNATKTMATDMLEIKCPHEHPLIVHGETNMRLLTKQGKTLGSIWFHTSFLDPSSFQLIVKKSDIDKLLKDGKKGHKKFAPTMHIVLTFEPVTSHS